MKPQRADGRARARSLCFAILVLVAGCGAGSGEQSSRQAVVGMCDFTPMCESLQQVDDAYEFANCSWTPDPDPMEETDPDAPPPPPPPYTVAELPLADGYQCNDDGSGTAYSHDVNECYGACGAGCGGCCKTVKEYCPSPSFLAKFFNKNTGQFDLARDGSTMQYPVTESVNAVGGGGNPSTLTYYIRYGYPQMGYAVIENPMRPEKMSARSIGMCPKTDWDDYTPNNLYGATSFDQVADGYSAQACSTHPGCWGHDECNRHDKGRDYLECQRKGVGAVGVQAVSGTPSVEFSAGWWSGAGFPLWGTIEALDAAWFQPGNVYGMDERGSCGYVATVKDTWIPPADPDVEDGTEVWSLEGEISTDFVPKTETINDVQVSHGGPAPFGDVRDGEQYHADCLVHGIKHLKK